MHENNDPHAFGPVHPPVQLYENNDTQELLAQGAAAWTSVESNTKVHPRPGGGYRGGQEVTTRRPHSEGSSAEMWLRQLSAGQGMPSWQ